MVSLCIVLFLCVTSLRLVLFLVKIIHTLIGLVKSPVDLHLFIPTKCPDHSQLLLGGHMQLMQPM